jgi:hypothetical protein
MGASIRARGKHRNVLKPQLQRLGDIFYITCMALGTIFSVSAPNKVFIKLGHAARETILNRSASHAVLMAECVARSLLVRG